MLTRTGNNNGFVLLSILLLLPMLMALAASALPEIAARQHFRIAHKVAQDIIEILNASKHYYVANDSWPGGIDGTTAIESLQYNGYLPPDWDGTSAFGQYVTYVVSPDNPYYFAVGTPVPSDDVGKYLERILPYGTYQVEPDRNILWGAVPPPGQGKAYDEIRRYADERFNWIVEEWVPENIKVEKEWVGCESKRVPVTWYDRYMPVRTTNIGYGRVETFVEASEVKIKIGPNTYSIGMVLPPKPEWVTNWAYNWTEYDIGEVVYGLKSVQKTSDEWPTTFD